MFAKSVGAARGSVGVFTYNLVKAKSKDITGKMAVMFSNPYDFGSYSNWFAVGIFDKHTQCNKDLFHQMYNESKDHRFVRGKAADGSTLKVQKDQVTIMATMSDAFAPVIKVYVTDN